jgi:hypothetical protein
MLYKTYHLLHNATLLALNQRENLKHEALIAIHKT